MSYSKTPRMREVAKKKARELAAEMRENRKLIKAMRKLNASNREIAVALGIPEDSPLFHRL
jgi:hypothetical protein